MIRVLSVLGTRPEAVKMTPVIRVLSAEPGVESLVCVTAQHRQILDHVLNLFGVVPDFDLDLMEPRQTLSGLTAKILIQLEPVLEAVQPDWVLVQGDTTTVMAASLLAYDHQVKVGHVEAGLRTGDKYQPFPEEIYRRIAGVVADLHFAPTEWSRQNLLKENIPGSNIVVTGNTAIDALHWALQQPFDLSSIDLDFSLETSRLVLVTAHRRENFGKPLQNICMAIKSLAETYQGEVQFVYPVHPNPNVQETAFSILGDVPHVTLLPPLDYLPMVNLLRQAFMVLTDSGGIQEEAAGLGIPALVMRNTTERPEGIQSGVLKLVGTDRQSILKEAEQLLENPSCYESMAKAANPFGDGLASRRIVQAILDYP
jgi:UDP-N-acetylglucosamine 2-epimerase (non-hydrolysing)